MRGSYAQWLLILVFLCTETTTGFGLILRNSDVRCIKEEREALLQFKQGLEDDYDLLSSWDSQEDCCKWEGINCSNQTDHVVTLDLGANPFVGIPEVLSGEISSSLLGLQHLTYLDLSYNYFWNEPLPEFIGSLTKLQYVNLSHTRITGTIPPQLGNLTHLISLDLSGNGLIEENNLDWLLNLSSLRYLDMNDVNLSMAVNWPDKVSVLPSLEQLYLSGCELSMQVPSVISSANSYSALSFLDLSVNHLDSSIFPWLFKYNGSLVSLDLSHNELQGLIPKDFGNLHNLQVLDLSNNNVSGEIIDLTQLYSLKELYLSNNSLNGSLTKGIGELFKLQVLDVSSNSLEGAVTEAHLSNLSNLHGVNFSFNSLSMKFSPSWVPSFRLDTIGLGTCKLGSPFPQWLRTQKNFSHLDMSDAGISDSIPNWFWGLSSKIEFLKLSRNQISGTIPPQWFSSRLFGCFPIIDLSDNHFYGPLPLFHSNLSVVNLSHNLFQGSITSLCVKNESQGHWRLEFLDISNNLLSGELPDCMENFSQLRILNLGNNKFSGRITKSIGRMCSHMSLRTLCLQHNNFSGELTSLRNCSLISLLDLGENRLSGSIPAWIGTKLQHLVILRLQSNLFSGSIPLQLCHLKLLHILELSQNSITGPIPECFNNFTAMAETESSYDSDPDFYITFGSRSSTITFNYFDNLLVPFRGKILEYSKTLGLVKVIDLSSNKLQGEIPKEITSLLGLIGLNISRNLLTGIIPQRIGDLKRLESLDLSRNHLSGLIPPSLATLTFLDHLSLSSNNLSGRIPTSTQLQSFDASAYAGNVELCGLPLLKKCPGDEAAQGPQKSSKHGEMNIRKHPNFHEHLWFYTSIALGFIVGFWGVSGLLLLKNSWRHAYFQYLDNIWDKLCVMIAICTEKLLRNFRTQC